MQLRPAGLDHEIITLRCSPAADEEEVLEAFGDERTGMTPEQVKALQVQLLQGSAVRRMPGT